VAILGTGTFSEDILAQLLEEEGYSVRHLEAHPTGLMDKLLDGVDVLLLAPGLNAEVREAFLEAISSIPKTAALPVLPLSSSLKGALLDELSASASWLSLFEELVGQIRDALESCGARQGATGGGLCGAEHPPGQRQADAL